MSNYRLHKIEAFSGNQIILWLEDEVTGQTEWEGGIQQCVRLTVDEAPAFIEQLISAYAETMQRLVMDLGAGGCRTCGNTRRVNRKLLDFSGTSGEPCPVCTPRAEERIRKAAMLRPRRKRNQ